MLFIQGDDSDLVWVVESGEVEILRTEEGGTEEHLTVVRSGTYFGEARGLVEHAEERDGQGPG
jgi:CRP-like cAMP-binding protein